MSEVKQLDRNTVCNLFKIRAPIWNGGKKMVGLDAKRITYHNEIHFTYVRKSDGELSIPDHYYFDGRLLHELDFERQNVKGTTLVIIPFEHLQILERI
jgi:hypothetical protein